MKIPVHYSLKVARKIADRINLPKQIANECVLESWSNCREQGLSILRFYPVSRKVVFAQQRNSDEIVIAYGHSSKFDNQSNMPSDEVWKDNICFKHNEIDKAVKFIENFLMGG